jgi:hypothetical protein
MRDTRRLRHLASSERTQIAAGRAECRTAQCSPSSPAPVSQTRAGTDGLAQERWASALQSAGSIHRPRESCAGPISGWARDPISSPQATSLTTMSVRDVVRQRPDSERSRTTTSGVLTKPQTRRPGARRAQDFNVDHTCFAVLTTHSRRVFVRRVPNADIGGCSRVGRSAPTRRSGGLNEPGPSRR